MIELKAPSPEVMAAVRVVDAYLSERLIELAKLPPEETPHFVMVGAASLVSSLREAFFSGGAPASLPVTVPPISPEELERLINEDIKHLRENE